MARRREGPGEFGAEVGMRQRDERFAALPQ